jgi:hypothetical protein
MKTKRAFLIGSVVFGLIWTARPILAIDTEPYFPLTVGTARLYLETINDNGNVRYDAGLEVVTKTEQIGAMIVSHLSDGFTGFQSSFPDFVDPYQLMAWDAQGLKYYKGVEFEYGQEEVLDFIGLTGNPLLVLPKSMGIGESYTGPMDLGTLTVIGYEDVTVPAGTFNGALKLQVQSDEDGEVCTSTQWYALGIGQVKQEEHCVASDGSHFDETHVLEAARSANTLFGSPPVIDGRVVSFALSTAQANGCQILIDGIAIEGFQQLFWGAFRLNPQTLAFELYDAGVGTKTLDQGGCPGLSGLDFDPSQPALWDHAKGYSRTAAFFDRLQLGGQTFLAQFDFSLQKLAFVLDRVWTSGGQRIF